MNPLLGTPVPVFARRAMAAASYEESIYFFGGVGANTGTESILDVSNDLWRFDTQALAWERIRETPPWPSCRRCVGWTTHKDRILLWGGSGIRDNGGRVLYTFLNDLWGFSPANQTWEQCHDTDDHQQTPFEDRRRRIYPFPRYTPVFHSVGDKLFLYGGYTEDRLGKRKLSDTWIFQDNVWFEIPSVEPMGYSDGARWPGVRYGSMSTCDGSRVYVCGGFSDDGDHIDLWYFDMERQEWTLLAPDFRLQKFPVPRYCASFSIYNGRIFLFGGRSRQNPKTNFNDLWTFDLSSDLWIKIHGNRAPHRYGKDAEFPAYHAKSAVAVIDSGWYIHGGEGLHGHVSDFWRFDLVRYQWELIQSARADDPSFW